MTFEDLKFRTYGEDNVQARVEINGFDISVVRNAISYGGEKGLYEIGVFDKGGMCDPLGWGDDVKGWLNPQDIDNIFGELKAL